MVKFLYQTSKKQQELELSKLQSKRSRLEYDIESISGDIQRKANEAEGINDVLQHTEADLEKIKWCVGEKRFGTCADIAREHRWHNAVEHFAYAAEWEWSKSHYDDAASRGVYQVEVHLRNQEKRYAKLEREIGKLTNEQTQKRRELQRLLERYF